MKKTKISPTLQSKFLVEVKKKDSPSLENESLLRMGNAISSPVKSLDFLVLLDFVAAAARK